MRGVLSDHAIRNRCSPDVDGASSLGAALAAIDPQAGRAHRCRCSLAARSLIGRASHSALRLMRHEGTGLHRELQAALLALLIGSIADSLLF
jgi:hypothetical protein